MQYLFGRKQQLNTVKSGWASWIILVSAANKTVTQLNIKIAFGHILKFERHSRVIISESRPQCVGVERQRHSGARRGALVPRNHDLYLKFKNSLHNIVEDAVCISPLSDRVFALRQTTNESLGIQSQRVR